MLATLFHATELAELRYVCVMLVTLRHDFAVTP
jgi:hypothetical protein